MQVNGESIVSDGVANIPLAGTNPNNPIYGLVSSGNGIKVASNGCLVISAASAGDCRAGQSAIYPIAPNQAHAAAFFGLAKAAGDTTQSATGNNAVGTYTDNAKSAISQMLNGSVSVSGTTPTINALPGVSYVCGEVSTIDIVTPETGIVDIAFVSGATPAVMTVTPPTGMTMKWAGGFDPTALEANTTYEINIKDGCLGVAGKWT